MCRVDDVNMMQCSCTVIYESSYVSILFIPSLSEQETDAEVTMCRNVSLVITLIEMQRMSPLN